MFKQISYKDFIIDIISMDNYVQGWLGAEGCPHKLRIYGAALDDGKLIDSHIEKIKKEADHFGPNFKTANHLDDDSLSIEAEADFISRETGISLSDVYTYLDVREDYFVKMGISFRDSEIQPTSEELARMEKECPVTIYANDEIDYIIQNSSLPGEKVSILYDAEELYMELNGLLTDL